MRCWTALQEGPPAGDLGVGIRSAVPTKVEALINVTEDGSGVATVELPPGFFEQIPQEDQLLAIGQLVLTITEVGRHRPGAVHAERIAVAACRDGSAEG